MIDHKYSFDVRNNENARVGNFAEKCIKKVLLEAPLTNVCLISFGSLQDIESNKKLQCYR